MNSSLFDPNNHVPEITPDDDWGDADGCAAEIPAAAIPTALPPRRTVAVASPSEPAPAGLRIDSTITRSETQESPQRLVVQEISGSVIRLEQSADAPQKVARQVTFHERPICEQSSKKNRAEGLHWGITQNTPARWMIGAGGAITVIVILSMMLLPAINAPNAPRVDPNAGNSGVVIEEKIAGLEAMNRLLGQQAEAMRVFQAFATATRRDEILSLIRDGAALEETLGTHWKPLDLPESWEPASADSSWNVLDINGKVCGILEGTLPDLSIFTAYFVPDGDRLLLDWKATSKFSTAPFEELEKGAGDPGEIRGVLSSADFYNDVWPESEYQSFRLLSPDGESAIWSYARRGSPADEKLGSIFRTGEISGEGQHSQRVTLRLKRLAEDEQPNQWLIDEMLHMEWVNP